MEQHTAGRAAGSAAGGTPGIPALDGLRGVAAILVVLTHVGFVTGSYALGPLGAVLSRFDFGVALFFALSGFLLTRPWVAAAPGTAPSLRVYARRRAARILPAYWVALAVLVATFDRGASWAAVASNATLTQSYTGSFLELFTQTWSLCTEVSFYVVLPFVAPWIVRLARTSTRRALLVLAAASIASWAWAGVAVSPAWPLDEWSALWLPGHLDWFAAGMTLAILEPVVRRGGHPWADALQRPGGLLAVAGAVFALACTPIAGPLTLIPTTPASAVAKESLYGVAALILVAVAAFAPTTSPPTRPLAGSVGRVLGRVSYGVFLWHLIAIEIVRSALGIAVFEGGLLPIGILGVGLSLLIAEASWRLVERPVLRRTRTPTR